MGNLDKLVFSNLSSKDVPLHNLEESFLTENMGILDPIKPSKQLRFHILLYMVQLNQSSIILVHHRSEGFDNMLNKQVKAFRH